MASIQGGQLGGLGVIVVTSADVGNNVVAAGNPVKISKIRLVGTTTAADVASICEASGSNPAWEAGPVVAGTVGQPDESDFYPDRPLILNGLKVLSCTHGKLYIYLGT